jgi:hypothetical protein
VVDVDRMLEEVAAAAGLDDYGHPSFRDGLDVLAEHIESARLSPIGHAVFDGMARAALANRLQVTEWHRSHGDVRSVEPDVAVVVLGFPRTGTTALSHLLGADPANRSLRGWEAASSIPPPTAATYWSDPRFEAARSTVSFVEQINPGFKAIHHDEPEDPVECAVPLSQHFASISISSMFNVEAYDDWLMRADLAHAYEWHTQVLQVLQSECPGPWQLKSPAHLYGIDVLASRYPKALFVQTHRDPARCVASTCSLVASLSGTFTDHDFRAYIAGHWPEMLAASLDCVLDYRERNGDDRFVDLAYHDIVHDPIGAVRTVYARLGRELDPATEATFREHLAVAKQHRYGTHRYALADFGLTRGPLDERLSRYLARFDPPREDA